MLGAAGMARIRRAPLNFLALTRRHYRSLWTVDRLHHPDTRTSAHCLHRGEPAAALRAVRTVARTRPDARIRTLTARALRAVRDRGCLRDLTAALAALGLIAAVAGLRLPPPFVVASVAALTAQAGLVLTALLAAGFTRFLLGLWPALVVACAFGAYAAKLKIKS